MSTKPNNVHKPVGTSNVCEWVKQPHDYSTECGYRGTGYNKHWAVCPYCGRWIHVINIKHNEEEHL